MLTKYKSSCVLYISLIYNLYIGFREVWKLYFFFNLLHLILETGKNDISETKQSQQMYEEWNIRLKSTDIWRWRWSMLNTPNRKHRHLWLWWMHIYWTMQQCEMCIHRFNCFIQTRQQIHTQMWTLHDASPLCPISYVSFKKIYLV